MTKSHPSSPFVTRLAVAVLFGAVAGGIGGAFVALWVTSNVVIERPAASPRALTFSGAIDSVTLANTAGPAIFALAPRSALRSVGSGKVLVEDAIVGRATALTADGWIVFDGAIPAKGLQAVSGDGRAATVGAVIIDRATGLGFVKLSLGGLPSLSFGQDAPLRSGQALFAALGRRETVSVTVARTVPRLIKPEDSVHSSEYLVSRIAITPPLGKAARGSPLFDASASLVGIVVGERGDHLIPVHLFSSLLPSLFKEGIVHRPYLGVRTIDLSVLITEESVGKARRGALLQDLPGKPAVRALSPAAAAGMVAGDVILEIEGEALSPGQTLAEALGTYRPGERVKLTVQKGDQTREVVVELGDTAEVRYTID